MRRRCGGAVRRERRDAGTTFARERPRRQHRAGTLTSRVIAMLSFGGKKDTGKNCLHSITAAGRGGHQLPSASSLSRGAPHPARRRMLTATWGWRAVDPTLPRGSAGCAQLRPSAAAVLVAAGAAAPAPAPPAAPAGVPVVRCAAGLGVGSLGGAVLARSRRRRRRRFERGESPRAGSLVLGRTWGRKNCPTQRNTA
jgi:hypothetical protein